MKHSYPHHLSEEILRIWDTFSERETSEGHAKLPDREVLDFLPMTVAGLELL